MCKLFAHGSLIAPSAELQHTHTDEMELIFWLAKTDDVPRLSTQKSQLNSNNWKYSIFSSFSSFPFFHSVFVSSKWQLKPFFGRKIVPFHFWSFISFILIDIGHFQPMEYVEIALFMLTTKINTNTHQILRKHHSLSTPLFSAPPNHISIAYSMSMLGVEPVEPDTEYVYSISIACSPVLNRRNTYTYSIHWPV